MWFCFSLPSINTLQIVFGVVADLSFQTAARILAAPVELALVIMKDLSQNFPTKAR